MKATRMHYEGRVQGVGFRWNAKNTAREYEVLGNVRNLPDGRVEVVVAGEPQEVEGFLQSIRESAVAGLIARETREEFELNSPLKGFQILS